MKYSDDVVSYVHRKYLARVIAAALCAPQDDDEREEGEENENGIFIKSGS